jgi:hypothetical protein
MTNEEIREQILTDAMADLKERAGTVINGIMSDLYGDYLPHVVSDTDSNISYRVEGCIKSMIAGKLEDAGKGLVWVSDGYGNNHLISLASYSDALKPLCDLMGATITDNRIKQLEEQVESLKNQLQNAYRSY